MAVDLEEYKKLKRMADDAKAQADRAHGALEQLMGELKNVYQCNSLAEGEALLETYNAEAELLEAAYYKEMEMFKTQWGDYLDGAAS
jgi:hypothetical protein